MTEGDELVEVIAGRWDAAAADFDAEPDHGLRDSGARAAWAERLLAWLPAPPADVLDLGCGTGTLSVLLADHGYGVAGIDVAPAMLAIARGKATAAGHDITFTLGDAAAPLLPASSLDAVLVRHLVWTLPDPHAALQCWVDLLRPGGRLVLIEGCWAAGARDDTSDPVNARLPWSGGATAAELLGAVTPLVTEVTHHDLSDDPVLWGREVTDERYAVVARA